MESSVFDSNNRNTIELLVTTIPKLHARSFKLFSILRMTSHTTKIILQEGVSLSLAIH